MITPDKVPGLKVWLDANDTSTINDGRHITDGTQVQKWVDKVAGYVLTSGSGTLGNNYGNPAANGIYKQRGPSYSVGRINGKNSILFGYYRGPGLANSPGDANTEDNLSFRRLACNNIPVIGSATYSQFIVFFPASQRLQPGKTTELAPTVEIVQNTEIIFSISDSSRMFTANNGDPLTNYPGSYIERQLILYGIRPLNTTTNEIIGYIDGANENSPERVQNPSLPIGTFISYHYANTVVDGPSSNREISDVNNRLYQYGKVNIMVNRFLGQGPNGFPATGLKRTSFFRKDSTDKNLFIYRYFGGAGAPAPLANRDRRATGSARITNPILTFGAAHPGYGMSNNVLRHLIDGGSLNKSLGREPYEGHICEYLFWDRFLTDKEANAVQAYLKKKWIDP